MPHLHFSQFQDLNPDHFPKTYLTPLQLLNNQLHPAYPTSHHVPLLSLHFPSYLSHHLPLLPLPYFHIHPHQPLVLVSLRLQPHMPQPPLQTHRVQTVYRYTHAALKSLEMLGLQNGKIRFQRSLPYKIFECGL